MYEIFFLQPGALFRATVVTLYITAASSLIGTAGGLLFWLIARGRASGPAYVLIDIIRAVPNLILIFAVFYFPFRDLGLVVPGPTASAIIGLAIAQAAYTADSFRAAEAQVPVGQVDGLFGIGATRNEVARLVTAPNLFRLTWALHVAFWIGNLKLSSLASVIGAPDLAYVARVTMASTFRSFEAWIAVAIVYVALTIPLTIVAKHIERHRYFNQ